MAMWLMINNVVKEKTRGGGGVGIPYYYQRHQAMREETIGDKAGKLQILLFWATKTKNARIK